MPCPAPRLGVGVTGWSPSFHPEHRNSQMGMQASSGVLCREAAWQVLKRLL